MIRILMIQVLMGSSAVVKVIVCSTDVVPRRYLVLLDVGLELVMTLVLVRTRVMLLWTSVA